MHAGGCVCIRVYGHEYSAYRGQRGGSDPWELELSEVTSDLAGAATITYCLTKVSKATGPVHYRLKPQK